MTHQNVFAVFDFTEQLNAPGKNSVKEFIYIVSLIDIFKYLLYNAKTIIMELYVPKNNSYLRKGEDTSYRQLCEEKEMKMTIIMSKLLQLYQSGQCFHLYTILKTFPF